MASLNPRLQFGPAKGQSSVVPRNSAAGMSRRDRSSVGNDGGAGFPKPLQGRYWAGCAAAYLRVSRVSPRITSARLCRGGGLYVRVADIRLLKGRKYEKNGVVKLKMLDINNNSDP